MQSLARHVVIVLTSSVLLLGTQVCNAQVQNTAPVGATPSAASASTVPSPTMARGAGNATSATGSIGRAALQLRDFEHDGIRLELGEIEFNNVTYRTTEDRK